MLQADPNFLNCEDSMNQYLKSIEDHFAPIPYESAKTSPDDMNEQTITEHRKCKVKFSTDINISKPLFDYVNSFNSFYLGFHLYPQAVEMQYTTYEGTEGGHFDWHIDQPLVSHKASQRKIAITLQLSNRGTDYEGADFQVEHPADCKIHTMPEHSYRKGALLLFPALYKHRVEPVTKGTRNSLVCWFHGKPWS